MNKGGESVLLQWAADSAFRFFPLIEHEDFGLTLHPFDLATNKVLALVGRLEARDWVDLIQCHARIQRLGYLAWAASGKDPGFSPASILEQAGRSARYSAAEIAALSFAGPPADACLIFKADFLSAPPPNCGRRSPRASCVFTKDGFAGRCRDCPERSPLIEI